MTTDRLFFHSASAERPPGVGRHESAWLLPWRDASDDELDRYLEFLDWRRWQAIHRSGAIERGIALPPRLDLTRRRYRFRLCRSLRKSRMFDRWGLPTSATAPTLEKHDSRRLRAHFYM